MNIYIPEIILWIVGAIASIVILLLAYIGYVFIRMGWKIRW